MHGQMKQIDELFNRKSIINKGKEESISGITDNTENVQKNFVFFAIKGTKHDGHLFINEAIKKGATCIVMQDKSLAFSLKEKYPDITFILTENTRKELALTAKKFFGNPDEKLNIIGITGTNGKTSVANIIRQYLQLIGKKVATTGTIGYIFEDRCFGNGMTTPSSIKWYELLNKFASLGAEYVVSEISSHAISQYRFYGTKFKAGVFTNLTQDHLDYHKDMENYFRTKKQFIDYVINKNSESVVSINVDCPYGKRVYDGIKDKDRAISYGYNSSEFKILETELDIKGTRIKYRYKNIEGSVNTKLLGEFNIYNVSAAFSLLLKMGFDRCMLEDLSPLISPVKGRFEIVYNKDFLVVNDYAHTPDALEKILKSLSHFKKGRIISVFGAGGDRDKTKRPLMGAIAEAYSDMIILTSDNPRSEKPENIIDDILDGIKNKKKVVVIIDREQAIKYAIQIAKQDDILLIAGKGHENYQIIGDKIIEFDDSDIAKKYLKENGYVQ